MERWWGLPRSSEEGVWGLLQLVRGRLGSVEERLGLVEEIGGWLRDILGLLRSICVDSGAFGAG